MRYVRLQVMVLALVAAAAAMPQPADAAGEGGGGSMRVVSLLDGALVSGLPAGADAVWLADARAGTVTRLDPLSNHVVATLAVDEDGALWVAATLQNTVVRVDPNVAGAVARTTVHLPVGIATGRDSVWVSTWKTGANGEVVRLDRRTGVVQATLPVGRDPAAIEIADGDVWVANTGGDSVSRTDARTSTMAATIPVAHEPVGVAIGADGVWVVSRGAAPLPPVLSRIDRADNAVVETIPLETIAPISMAAGSDSLWVTSRGVDRVVRIGPVLLPRSASAPDGPPLTAIALAMAAILLLAVVSRHRPSAPPDDRRKVPAGQLLNTLLLTQQASRRAAGRAPGISSSLCVSAEHVPP